MFEPGTPIAAVIASDDEVMEQEQKRARTGRQDLKKIEVNQPPNRTEGPGFGGFKQPAVETQGLIENDGDRPLNDEVPRPLFQAMPVDSPAVTGPSRNPGVPLCDENKHEKHVQPVYIAREEAFMHSPCRPQCLL